MQLQPHDANALVAYQAFGLMQTQMALAQKDQALQEMAKQLEQAKKAAPAASLQAQLDAANDRIATLEGMLATHVRADEERRRKAREALSGTQGVSVVEA